MPSGRFFGWVIGGRAGGARGRLAGQRLGPERRAAVRDPGTAAVEDGRGAWLLDLLGLPAGGDVGFVTGATMANFTGLVAGRHAVLADAGGT